MAFAVEQAEKCREHLGLGALRRRLPVVVLTHLRWLLPVGRNARLVPVFPPWLLLAVAVSPVALRLFALRLSVALGLPGDPRGDTAFLAVAIAALTRLRRLLLRPLLALPIRPAVPAGVPRRRKPGAGERRGEPRARMTWPTRR